MSKITNDGLTRSGTRCFIAVSVYGYSGRVKGLKPDSGVGSYGAASSVGGRFGDDLEHALRATLDEFYRTRGQR